jgi:hypothetical protein
VTSAFDWRGCQGPHGASGRARVLLAHLDLMHDGEDEARDVLPTLNPQQASGIHSPQQFVHLYVHMTNMLPLECMHVTVLCASVDTGGSWLST